MSDTKNLQGLQKKADSASVSDAQVHSFMSKNPLSITVGTKIFNAIQALAMHKVGSAPVVDSQNHIVGVVSEHDLLIQTATRDVIEPINYTPNPVTLAPETKLNEALILLYKKKVRRIPVVTKDRTIVGLVTRMDVLMKLIGKSNR